jgi:hypothetical protein
MPFVQQHNYESYKAAIAAAEVVKELEQTLEDNKRQELYTSES